MTAERAPRRGRVVWRRLTAAGRRQREGEEAMWRSFSRAVDVVLAAS